MDDARRAARWAYEKGRMADAVVRAGASVPVALALYLTGATPSLAAQSGLAMFGFAAVGGWWRTDLGRGAVAGAATVMIPMVLSVYMETLGCAMSPSECATFCLYGSATLGCVAGYLLGQAAALRSRKDGFWFLGATVTTATLAVTVGCGIVGFGSTFGLAIGLLLVGVPTFAWVRSTT